MLVLRSCVGFFWTNRVSHLGVILSYGKQLFALGRGFRNWECLKPELVL